MRNPVAKAVRKLGAKVVPNKKRMEKSRPVDDDDGELHCTNKGGHSYVLTGTAYGGDDESYFGEGRCYCEFCGADGDG